MNKVKNTAITIPNKIVRRILLKGDKDKLEINIIGKTESAAIMILEGNVILYLEPQL